MVPRTAATPRGNELSIKSLRDLNQRFLNHLHTQNELIFELAPGSWALLHSIVSFVPAYLLKLQPAHPQDKNWKEVSMHPRRSPIVAPTVGMIVFVVALVMAGIVVTGAPTQAAGNESLNNESTNNESINIVLAHFAPFADTSIRSRVNVHVDGQSLAIDLAYLEQVRDLSLDAGTHEIVVDPVEWVGGTITQTIEIPAPGAVAFVDPGAVVAVVGGTSGMSLDVFVRAIEQASPASGAQIRLTNVALFAVDGDSEYTLCNADGTDFYGIKMVPYGKSSDYVVIPAGMYPVYLAGSHTGCDNRLTPNLTIVFSEKSIADLYAVGTNTSSAFPNSLTVVSPSAVVLTPSMLLPLVMN